MTYQTLYKELVKILTHVVEHNIYGSVEIFFEKGKVTQITQRTIKKVHPDDNNYGISEKHQTSGPHTVD